jgi:hypothetical protein
MTKARWTAAVGWVALAACGTKVESGNPASNGELRVASYNAGIAPNFEEKVDERRPRVLEKLAAQAKDLDLLCVQEFWLEEDYHSLAAAVRSNLPHGLRPEPRPGTGAGACPGEEIDPLIDCLTDSACSDKIGAELQACAAGNCLDKLPSCSECLGCILAKADENKPMTLIDAECRGPAGLVCGQGGEPSDPAIYGGSYDIGLLSRHPFTQTSFIDFGATFVRAGVQHGRVSMDGQEVDVFCTHLASEIGGIPYSGPHGSFDGERGQQIGLLLDFIRETAGDRPVILLGDLNTGPGEADGHFQELLGFGLTDATAGVDCTLCPDNTFSPGRKPRRVDHVLTRGLSVETAGTMLTEAVEIGGEPTSLSDHHGVTATLVP